MAKSPFGSLADLIAQLGVQPEQPKPQEPGAETPKPQDPDKPKPEVPQSDLGKVFDKKATFTLTNKTDKFPAKEGENKGDDVIKGKYASLPSEQTLNAKDKIDGGEGSDTLIAELKAGFNGFNSQGGVKNVETIALANVGKSTYTFNTKGIEKAEAYLLKGNINLKELDSVAKVYMMDRVADATIAFAKDVTKGEEDQLELTFQNVAKKDSKDKPTHAKIKADGIEKLKLTVAGNNFIDSNIAAEEVSVEGEGKLNFKTAATTIKTFDASEATGDLKADLSSTALNTLKLGSGNDKVKLDVSKASKVLEVAGGDGEDTLVLDGAGRIVAYQMDGVETIELGSIAPSGLMFAAGAAEGLGKVVATKDTSLAAAGAKFVELGERDFTIQLAGANANTNSAKIELDHKGASTIKVDTPSEKAKADAPEVNKLGLVLANSSKVSLEVAEKMDYQGVIKADEAEEITLTLHGQKTVGAIEAAKATTITVDKVAGDSTFAIKADEATELTITEATKKLALAGSSLKKLGTLNVTSSAHFDANSVALEKAQTVTLMGGGAASLGALGSATAKDTITLTASNLKDIEKKGTPTVKALTLQTITTDEGDINVTASEIRGDVALGGAIKTTTSGNITIDIAAKGEIDATDQAFASAEELNLALDAGKAIKLNDLTAKKATLDIASKDTVTINKLGDASTTIAEGSVIKALGAVTVTTTTTAKTANLTLDTKDNATFTGAVAADALVLDASKVLGTLTFTGGLTIKESINLTGSKLTGVTATITHAAAATDLAATLASGIADDTITINAATTTTGITVKGDLGAGNNTLNIVTTGVAGNPVIDLTEFSKANVSFTLVDSKKETIKLGAAKETVKLASATNAVATDVDVIEFFTTGANGDKLVIGAGSANTAIAFADSNTATVKAKLVNGKATLVKYGEAIGDTNFATAGATGFNKLSAKLDVAATSSATGSNTIVIVAGTDKAYIYSVTDADKTLASTDLKLVGVLDGNYTEADFTGNIAGLVAAS